MARADIWTDSMCVSDRVLLWSEEDSDDHTLQFIWFAVGFIIDPNMFHVAELHYMYRPSFLERELVESTLSHRAVSVSETRQTWSGRGRQTI